MADPEHFRQAERDRRAELRAALLAGEDTTAVRAEIKRIAEQIGRATAKNDDDEIARQRINASAVNFFSESLANEVRASLDAQLAQFEPPASLNHEGLT